jgi:hypothetical protein
MASSKVWEHSPGMISVDAGPAGDGPTRDAVMSTALFRELETLVGRERALRVVAGPVSASTGSVSPSSVPVARHT